MRPFSIIFVSILIALTFASCQSNEEKLIRDYQSTITNPDGSTTKINIGKTTFKSIETIDVDGKFVYSLQQDDSTKVNKDSLESLIKECLHYKNKNNLWSVIAFKRSQECGPYEWQAKYDYKKSSDEYLDEAIELESRAYSLGILYNNFENVSFQLIKAVYDRKLGELERKGITDYYVYDKQNNKILKSFNAPLGKDFVKYYRNSVNNTEKNTFNIELYKYSDLLDKSLKELISML